ncbi:hypothetical protein HBA55_24355 [Pseudomaricurvus alkylphenolicus]|uniref:hypothetical protein n=1 Tax=Pseudomaricurvus alkylphenolicus TaxID=1306991 RepID=UPI00141F50FC|nr:hypothetical protein [Pseudomaricurvus alkylphenolicus]NIB42762.1 hypothetical protein [Pseudomaricurvus alkylphenolicus]
MLTAITRSPYLNILSGLILLITAASETLATLGETFTDTQVGAHHGLLVFALVHVIREIPELLHGFKELKEGEDELRKDTSSP